MAETSEAAIIGVIDVAQWRRPAKHAN